MRSWWVVAVAMLATACDDGASGTTGLDAGPTDALSPGRDGMTADAGPVSAQCAAAIDINAMTPQAGGGYVLRGSSISAARTGGLVAPDGCLATRGAEFVHQTIYRYRMTARGRLFASTIRAGTDAALDTVITIADACSPLASTLACNDNRAVTPVAPASIQSIARTTRELDAGTTVFIAVGSASPPSGVGNREQSNYELTVYEAAAVPEGGACTTNDQCDANAFCFVARGETSGFCRVTGREGGFCRPARDCDAGFTCRGQDETLGRPGACFRNVATGGDCTDLYTVCGTDDACRPAPMSVGRYVCVGAGAQGGICRVVGAPCDGSLMCIGGYCRTQSAAAQPCDPANYRTACVVAGQTCVGIAPPTSGICAPAVPEVEPNDDPRATTPAPVTSSTVFTGSLPAVGDVDCFRFTVTEGTSIIAETHENNGLCAMGTDTLLKLHGADGAELMSDDDSGNAYCSLIDGARPFLLSGINRAYRMRAGTYAICAELSTSPSPLAPSPMPIARYFLSLRFVPAS